MKGWRQTDGQTDGVTALIIIITLDDQFYMSRCMSVFYRINVILLTDPSQDQGEGGDSESIDTAEKGCCQNLIKPCPGPVRAVCNTHRFQDVHVSTPTRHAMQLNSGRSPPIAVDNNYWRGYNLFKNIRHELFICHRASYNQNIQNKQHLSPATPVQFGILVGTHPNRIIFLQYFAVKNKWWSL